MNGNLSAYLECKSSQHFYRMDSVLKLISIVYYKIEFALNSIHQVNGMNL